MLVGAAYAGWRWYRSRVPESSAGEDWQPQPFPYPPMPRDTDRVGDEHPHVHVPAEVVPGGGPEIGEESTTLAPWMDPIEGTCPASHPVKAKLSSGIYHSPGSSSYERTRPDRCYLDGESAEADGLRAPKR